VAERQSSVARLGLTGETALLVFASLLLGLANAVSHGTYLAPALGLIGSALAVLGAVFVRQVRGVPEAAAHPRSGLFVLAGLSAMPLVALLDPKVLAHAEGPWLVGRAGALASVVLLFSYAPFLGRRREPGRSADLRFWAFALIVLVSGLGVLRASPAPDIDVWTIQTRGAEALLAGENPYATVTVPDTDPEATFTVPYVYPPTALYAGVLGLLTVGDVRGAPILWILITGLALRAICGGRGNAAAPALVRDAPALLVWQTPLLYLVIERAWLDPLQLALISVGVWAFVARGPMLAAVVLGFAASSKQSMFWLVPLAALVLGLRPRHWGAMAAAGALPVLPFLIWDFRALKYANFDFMTSLSPRSDALAVAVFVQRNFGVSFPHQVSFLLTLVVVGVACLKVRGAAAFGTALTLGYLVFFLFNRWAFANYYFLVGGLAALAAAASARRPAAPTT
jgi:hypothetical protein